MAVQLQWRPSLCAADFPSEAYEALRQRLAGSTPFNHLGWLRAAERALAPDQQLAVLLGYEHGKLRLCLPLVRSLEAFGPLRLAVVRHLGYPLSDRIALLIELPVDAAAHVLRSIRRHLPHALLQLSELPAAVAGDAWLRCWARRSSTCQRRLSCRVPVHRISAADRLEISGDPRYKLRRARKRIAACGAQQRRVLADAQNVQALLDAIAAVEDASWKGDDAVGVFSGAARREWMYQAFTALAAEGLVCAVLLELDGRCISYRLCLLERGRVYDYNLAFLPAYRDLGSGRVLLEALIHWGLDEGWEWVDASRVSRHNSSHQLHERCTGYLEHWRLSCFSWRPSGIVLGLALRCWQRLGPWRGRAGRSANAVPPANQEAEHALEGDRQRG